MSSCLSYFFLSLVSFTFFFHYHPLSSLPRPPSPGLISHLCVMNVLSKLPVYRGFWRRFDWFFKGRLVLLFVEARAVSALHLLLNYWIDLYL